jgi:hypothetical protein
VLVLPSIGPFIGLCSLSSEEGNDGCLRQGRGLGSLVSRELVQRTLAGGRQRLE